VESARSGASWTDFDWLRRRLPGPVPVKGILHPAEAVRRGTGPTGDLPAYSRLCWKRVDRLR